MALGPKPSWALWLGPKQRRGRKLTLVKHRTPRESEYRARARSCREPVARVMLGS